MTCLHVLVMGVAGCGKSAVGMQLAKRLGLPLIEGDSFHPSENIRKMQQGVALDDGDRLGWLQGLAEQLVQHPAGAVLTCSALKKSYRELLRGGSPDLRFVHLELTQETALARVASRPGHFYPPSLVASQFEALEDPAGEQGVTGIDASQPVEVVVATALRALDPDSTIRN